jgi:hypothetical protein
MLGDLQRSPGLELIPSDQCKKVLLVWVAFVQEIENWKPIPHRPMAAQIWHISFSSDAAGFA